MNKILRYFLFIGIIFFSTHSFAQNQNANKDTVIQLYGVVMSADSLRALEATSIIVQNFDIVFIVVKYLYLYDK